MTKISWVKGHAEKGGAKTNDHEKQYRMADADAEKAYAREEPPTYREGYCAQFDTLKGPVIDGSAVAHKMGLTVLSRLQQTQYLEYWQNRTGAGAWCKNADIAGHTSACKRARKGDPKKLPCTQYKCMNGRQPTFDIVHLRNHRYDPTAFEWEQA